MHILITNDDGWGAKGIMTLVSAMRQLGEVTVIAPDGPRSGQSSAMTVTQPVRFQKIIEEPGLTVYTSNGTPTDCVKLANHVILRDKAPDLICSGINHGDNGTVNVIYSGTMGAVFEGCEHGVLSIGWSLCDYPADADFTEMVPYIIPLTRKILAMPRKQWQCWNINAPKGPIRGVRVARHCHGYWTEEYREYHDPSGKPFYLLTGRYVNQEPEATDTDQWACANGYISVCPTTMDMTDHAAFTPELRAAIETEGE